MNAENKGSLSTGDQLFPKQFEGNTGYKITIVVIVLLVVFLLFLGINIFYIIINLMILTGDFFVKSLGLLGYVSGGAINETTTTVANATKTGVDITSGAIHSAGNVIKSVSKPFVDNETTANIDKSTSSMNKISPTQVSPVSQVSPVPPNTKESFSLLNTDFEPNMDLFSFGKKEYKTEEKWCLVGSPDGIRSCISINDYDKCMSSQIFPSQKECMNPVLMM